MLRGQGLASRTTWRSFVHSLNCKVCWQCPHGGHIRPTLCVDAGRRVRWQCPHGGHIRPTLCVDAGRLFIDSVHMVDTLDQRHVLISAAVKDAYLVVCWQCPHGGHIRPTLCVDAGRHEGRLPCTRRSWIPAEKQRQFRHDLHQHLQVCSFLFCFYFIVSHTYWTGIHLPFYPSNFRGHGKSWTMVLFLSIRGIESEGH